MKIFFQALCLLATSFAFSQDAINGYYITGDGQKITGEYEYDEFSSPQNLRFRTGMGEFSTPNPETIQEYGIADSYKFVKYTVDIDVDDPETGTLSTSYEPIFQKKVLFLNVIAEGDATLYSYYNGHNIIYFIKTQSLLVPQQLVYRNYLLKTGKPAENNEYKAQLSKILVCNGLKGSDIAAMGYNKYALTDFIATYNTCKGDATKIYDNKAGKKVRLFFSAYTGIYAFSFDISGSGVPSLNKDTGISLALGSELELNFASDKFSIFFRAEVENVNSETEGTYAPDDVAGSHKVYVYKTGSAMISAFLGPRYYFKLTDKGRLFADASAVYTIATGGMDMYSYVVSSTTQYPREYVDRYSLGDALSINIGVGYSFDNRFAAELRYNTARNIIGDLPSEAKISYSWAGVNLRYTF